MFFSSVVTCQLCSFSFNPCFASRLPTFSTVRFVPSKKQTIDISSRPPRSEISCVLDFFGNLGPGDQGGAPLEQIRRNQFQLYLIVKAQAVVLFPNAWREEELKTCSNGEVSSLRLAARPLHTHGRRGCRW